MLIEVSKLFGTKIRLFLKHEGVNPTGTQKDRIANRHVCKAKLLGAKRIVAASCGNFGVSLSYFARMHGLEVTIFVPRSFESPRVSEILEYGASVERPDCSYEECVELSSMFAKQKNFYDANPVKQNRDLEYAGYGTILQEILSDAQLKDSRVAYLCVPVSNGVTLAGLYFQSLVEKQKITFVAGSCLSNPIITSILNGSYSDLTKLTQEETEINEPLINWRSFDGETACRAVISTGGWGVSLTDEELRACANFLNQHLDGISTHPAATAGLLAALKKMPAPEHDEKDVCVALVTSKNY